MEKVKAEYYFKKEYADTKGNPQTATVILEVNYKTRNFSINPFFSPQKGFLFRQSSQHWQMWLAVLAAIEEAIIFGNNELNITDDF